MAKLSKSAKGTISELKAITQLTQSGHWVAKSLDPQCPFDIVAVSKCGKIKLIDVKTICYRKSRHYKINRIPTKKQKALKVELMMIDNEIQDAKTFKKKKNCKDKKRKI
jgi:hypothetical protein